MASRTHANPDYSQTICCTANPLPTPIAMTQIQTITPCLWFDTQAENAAHFYTAIFDNSSIDAITRYPDAGQEVHGKAAGSVLTVAFRLAGQSFTALNGGQHFKFNEAVSLQVHCDTQSEVDYFWEKLSAGGDPAAQQCGWLKDQYGLSWQIVPRALIQMIQDPNSGKAARAMQAMMEMKKLDIAALQATYEQ
jgi:predicted 3-demethylubiquinone-9 3-methyltransferase (glyoxalase superfamily)